MPTISIPNETEIAKLPLLAIVAYGARCARRVAPGYLIGWQPPPHYTDAINDSINIAEVFAATNRLELSTSLVSLDTTMVSAVASGAGIAANCAQAAINASEAAHIAVTDAKSTSSAAASAAHYAALAAPSVAFAAIQRDYDLLLHASQAENWTDETPVPPEFFGPMWPDGPPEGWPESAKEECAEGRALEITLDIPEDATDEEILEILEGLGEDMERFYRACGGRGLTIGPIEISSAVDAPVGAPS